MTALLDTDPAIIGEQVDGVVVRHVDDLPEIAADSPLAIGVITTPASVAQRVADMMVGAGVRSILNFAPRVLEVPPDILLRYVDLSIELQVMSFYQSRSLERRAWTGCPGSARSGSPPAPPTDRLRPGRSGADWRPVPATAMLVGLTAHRGNIRPIGLRLDVGMSPRPSRSRP